MFANVQFLGIKASNLTFGSIKKDKKYCGYKAVFYVSLELLVMNSLRLNESGSQTAIRVNDGRKAQCVRVQIIIEKHEYFKMFPSSIEREIIQKH